MAAREAGGAGAVWLGIAEHDDDLPRGGTPAHPRVAVRVVELHRVVPAVNRQRFHAAQEHRDPPRLRRFDDAAQVLFHLFDGHAPQPVVGAELEHQHANVLVEQLFVASECAR